MSMLLQCRIPLASFELDIDVAFDARVASIFGPSGSGKTTLLDAIAGLRTVAAGEIEIEGKVLFSSARGIDCPPQERGIGYVPQETALFPHLSVRKNILFGARRKTDSDKAQAFLMDHVIDVLEIRSLLDRSVMKLSGGESQRVALARAILSRPQLLLLDEPLAALDVGLKEKILPYLARVRDEFTIPIVYVTHNMSEVLTLADWVLMIRQGRLIAQGVPSEIFRSASAIAKMEDDTMENIFNLEIVSSDREGGRIKARTETGLEIFIPYVEEPPNRSLQVRLSADDILVGTQQPEGISAGNVLAGKIRNIEAIKGQAVLTVDAGDVFYVRLTPSAVARLELREGMPVFLIIKTRSFRLL
jgi:molybdate transport system ATP-binding protein